MNYVLIGVAAILLLVALDALYARVINRKRLAPLADGIATMRRTAALEIRYRPAGPTDALPADSEALFERAGQELSDHGLILLGDLVEQQPGGAASGVTRWFVDASHSVCGWFGTLRSRETGALTPVMLLFSESDGGEFFITGRGASSRALARPPFVHRTYCDWDEGLAQVLERHRAAAGGGAAALRRLEQTGDAVAVLTRLREAVTRWRASQPPAALLEADVRSVLQERYDELGPYVLRLMTSPQTS